MRLLDKFNKKANTWLSDLEDCTPAELSVNPTINTWSMAELYDHVMRVTRTYQVPNLLQSLGPDPYLKKRKNTLGLLLFNMNILPPIKLSIATFPTKLQQNFTPIKRTKDDLIADFKIFINEINELAKMVEHAPKESRQYHAMFGDITTKDWFALVEIHLRHHDKQKRRIKRHIEKIKYGNS